MGWQDAPLVDASSAQTPDWMKAPLVTGNADKASQDAGLGPLGGVNPNSQELMRQLGLATRYGVEGAAALPAMLASPINKLLGLGNPSEAVSGALTNAGLPSPATGGERIIGDASRAIASTGPFAKAFEAISKVLDPGTAQAVFKILSEHMGAQSAGAASAGASGGAAREGGAGPLGQEWAALAGGVAGPSVASAAEQAGKGVGRFAQSLVEPFTQSGQQQIVGKTLNRLAADPAAAQANLNTPAETFIPGSEPTTAQQARDVGLSQVERSLANRFPDFAQRGEGNSQARWTALSDIAGSETDLAAATKARETNANANYAAANAQPAKLDTQGLVELSKRPSFQMAMQRAATLAAESGMPEGQQTLNNPQYLHYIKLGFDDIIDRAPQSDALGRNGLRALVGTKNKFLDLLDAASPEYANARQQFAADSQPVNQMETLQGIAHRTQGAAPDSSGTPVLSQAKWKNVVTNQIAELRKTLTPDQVDTLQNIGADLDRGTVSGAGKAIGSNTTQNLTTANVLGDTLGGKLAGNALLRTAVGRPLGFLYKIPEEDVQQLMKEAMLDPTTARVLMSQATPKNVDALADLLGARYMKFIQGGAQAATTQATGAFWPSK